MSKLNLKTNLWTINMPVDHSYKVIIANDNRSYKELYIMTGINELEYKKLANLNDLIINRGNCRFHIAPDDVLCYGDIDFHNGSEDCETLDTFNILNNLTFKGIPIPSRYNYDKHECTSDKKFYKVTETFKVSVLCRYLHGCLGKPKYTLIFREII